MAMLDMPVLDRQETVSEEALILKEMDGEIVFIIRIERETLPGLYQLQASFRAEARLHETGSAIRLSIKISHRADRYDHFDTFLDPMQLDSQAIFHRLMAQHQIEVLFEGPDGTPLREVSIPFSQSERNELARVVMRGIAHDLKLHRVDCRWTSTPSG